MKKWVLGVCEILLAFVMILSMPTDRTQAAVAVVKPMIVDSLKEAKERFAAEQGILYSKKDISTPTVYEFTVSERGWFGTLCRSAYAVDIYSDESFTSQDYAKSGEWRDNNATIFSWYNYYYLVAGTYCL